MLTHDSGRALTHLRAWVASLAACALVAWPIAVPGNARAESGSSIPLADLLADDGSIDLSSGFEGTIDTSGWTMATDSAGAPRFVRAGTSSLGGARSHTGNPDDHWIGRFSAAGASGTVHAVAVFGSIFFVGGEFTTIGGIEARHVAAWNGVAWSPLAGGTDGPVYALTAYDGALVVAGEFDRVTDTDGTLRANNIAAWNGTGWDPVGGSGTCLPGGNFGLDCDEDADCDEYNEMGVLIATGDCSEHGTNGVVRALAVVGATLYAGGSFSTTDEKPDGFGPATDFNNIGAWNGSFWRTLDGGTDGRVRAMVVYGGNLFVGGDFLFVGGDFLLADGGYVGRVASWDGLSWSGLGFGIGGTCDSGIHHGEPCTFGPDCDTSPGDGDCNTSGVSVAALAVLGAKICAGGRFPSAGGTLLFGGRLTQNVACWDSSTLNWSGLGPSLQANGVDGPVQSMVAVGDRLFVGGVFGSAAGRAVNNVAQWDESDAAWSRLGEGTDASVEAMGTDGSKVLVGGWFTRVDDLAANRIAQWDTATSGWTAFTDGSGAGSSNPVRALAVLGNDVYVGGTFVTIGGIRAAHVARWDGVSWSALDGGTNGTVQAIEVIGSDVYVGGGFNTVINDDGSGGSDSILARGIARWDSTAGEWSRLAGGIAGAVYALEAAPDGLYVAGKFDSAFDLDTEGAAVPVEAHSVALWDPSAESWSALGDGINGICINGPGFFGPPSPHFGEPCTADIQCDSAPAEGDGVCLANEVFALALLGDELFVGGRFPEAGGVAVGNIASWDTSTSTWSGLEKSGGGTTSLPGRVLSLAAFEGRLYAGGEFACTDCMGGGGGYLNHVGAWDPGTSLWSPLPDPAQVSPAADNSGVSGPVLALTPVDDVLYLGGSFEAAFAEDPDDPGFPLFPPVAAGRVVSWQSGDTQWIPLGSGTNDTVQAMVETGGSLYVGGRFTRAGGKTSVHLGLYTTGTCGNGVVGGGEDCDPADPAAGACCNTTTCSFGAGGAVCGPAVGGCDAEEICDGASSLCPTDVREPAGFTCRSDEGLCDIEEQCNGVGAGCPSQMVEAQGTICRSAADSCDADEVCTGESPLCPGDEPAPADTECRALAGVCDRVEVCDGVNFACPADAKRASGCRAVANECDVYDYCDGVGDDCPADAKQPADTPCSSDANQCTDDLCDGAGTCIHPDRTGTCEDGDLCTGPDQCVAGTCVSGGPFGCDDGDLCTVDSCDSGLGCLNTPVVYPEAACASAGNSKLRIRNQFGSVKDRLSWSWRKGDAFDQASLGDPEVDTVYSLCFFDRVEGVDRFAGSISMAPGEGWRSVAPRGLRYKDRYAINQGLYKFSIKTGTDGRTGVSLSARGTYLPMPSPFGPSAFFDLDPELHLQLLNSEGMCWTSDFTLEGTSSNTPWAFKAVSP